MSSSRMSNKDRPASAQSKGAWVANGVDNPAMDNDDDKPESPSDMSVYEGSNADDDFLDVLEENDDCCTKVGKGIRSLWATRHTEDTGADPELYVKTTLRELIIYIVFLIVLCLITFLMTSSTMYYYTKVMSELFLDSSFPETKGTFRGMTTMHDFWRFAETPLVDGLYWESWYNNQALPDDEMGYIFYENKLLGVPRIRQLKVRNDSCKVHDDFAGQISQCYDVYSEAIEFKGSFGLKDGPAWNYSTEAENEGSSHSALLSSYSGAGFVADLKTKKADSLAIIKELKNNLWIDRGTRAIFVDFSVYNANINLFCIIRLVVELPATGGALPSWSFRTVKLLRYVTVTDFFVLACEVILALFILYYMVEEGIEIKKHKGEYFKSVWNWLDILVILLTIVCLSFNVYRTLAVKDKLANLLEQPESFQDFEFLSYWQVHYNEAIACTVFLAWVKVFKYISFNKTMTQLSTTLASCAKDLAGFAVMFFIIFLAFAQLGYLIFGTQVKDFSCFEYAVYTLFRIILGDFDFTALEEANRVLGPIFFILYVFFVFFVLLNMFLAIINDTYSEVKADLANQKNEFEMGDYFKKGYNRMVDRLNIKRDKIVDIQKALEGADMDGDAAIDYDEWRQSLKMKGYADQEIEAVFSKYDVDGDRVLDKNEQNQMSADLEGQQMALDKEYEDLDHKMKNDDSDGDSDDDDDDSMVKTSRSRKVANAVSYDEHSVLIRRVDRMELSIGSIVSKIDAVLVKLEAMERAKAKRRETMGKILDSITQSDGVNDEEKRQQMEKLVREELERWDTEPGATSGTASASPTRPASSNKRPDTASKKRAESAMSKRNESSMSKRPDTAGNKSIKDDGTSEA